MPAAVCQQDDAANTPESVLLADESGVLVLLTDGRTDGRAGGRAGGRSDGSAAVGGRQAGGLRARGRSAIPTTTRPAWPQSGTDNRAAVA